MLRDSTSLVPAYSAPTRFVACAFATALLRQTIPGRSALRAPRTGILTSLRSEYRCYAALCHYYAVLLAHKYLMEGMLQSHLLAALEDYEEAPSRSSFIDFVPKFLYVADNNGPIPQQLKRIVPWCRRWLDTEHNYETELLERKITFILDIYLQARKYYK